MTRLSPRSRKVRILATLGPASDTPEMIRALFVAGADAFRVNMSHGDHEGHAQVIAAIRALEKETGRPTTILVFDPTDYYFPFAIENFKLPASCGCFVGAFLGH